MAEKKSNVTKKVIQPKDDFKGIVRLQSTDIKGNYKLSYGLRRIKGIGFRVADFITLKSGLSPNKKIGYLTDDDVKVLNDTIDGLSTSLPLWMKNRRKDPLKGTDLHLLTSNIVLALDNDIKLMKKIRNYKGIRHMFRLPVRGQRTKSNFRKNKKKIRKRKK